MSSSSGSYSSLKVALLRLETRTELALGMKQLEAWVTKEKSEKVLDKAACFSTLLNKIRNFVEGFLTPFQRRNNADTYKEAMTEQINLFLQNFKWGSSSHIFKSLASGIMELVNSNCKHEDQKLEPFLKVKQPLEEISLLDLVPQTKLIQEPIKFVMQLVGYSIQGSQDWSVFEKSLYNLASLFRVLLEPHLGNDQDNGPFSSPLPHLLKQTFFRPLLKTEIIDLKTLSQNLSWNRLWESIELQATDIQTLAQSPTKTLGNRVDVQVQTTPPLSPVLRRVNTNYSQQSTGLPLSNSQTPLSFIALEKSNSSKQRGEIITSSFESIAFQDLPLQSQASQYSSNSQSQISSRDLWTNSMNEEIRSIVFKPEPIKKKKKRRSHATPDKREKKEYQTPQPKSDKQSQRLQSEQQELIEAQLLLKQSPKRVISNSIRITVKEEPCKVLFPENQI